MTSASAAETNARHSYLSPPLSPTLLMVLTMLILMISLRITMAISYFLVYRYTISHDAQRLLLLHRLQLPQRRRLPHLNDVVVPLNLLSVEPTVSAPTPRVRAVIRRAVIRHVNAR
jgi:hypothetical protein